jgi:hypothetical protein
MRTDTFDAAKGGLPHPVVRRRSMVIGDVDGV